MHYLYIDLGLLFSQDIVLLWDLNGLVSPKAEWSFQDAVLRQEVYKYYGTFTRFLDDLVDGQLDTSLSHYVIGVEPDSYNPWKLFVFEFLFGGMLKIRKDAFWRSSSI